MVAVHKMRIICGHSVVCVGALRRIDYILYSPGISCDSAEATWELSLGSDHRSVKAAFAFMPGHTKPIKRRGVKNGWIPKCNSEGIAEEYDENIMELMQRDCHTLGAVQSILRDAASITKSKYGDMYGIRPEKLMVLKTLIYERRHCRVGSILKEQD